MSTPSGLPFTVNGQLPDLHEPTLIIQLQGWIDASGAAAAAAEHIVDQVNATALIEFDPDTFIDYRARRPTMELRDGVNTRIVWSVPEILVGVDTNGRDVLILTGPEPDVAWRHFSTTVSALATQLGVVTAIGLGAYPYGAPHTRPTGLTATTPDPAVAARLGFRRNSLDAPAGVQAILEHSLTNAGVATFGLWAQIPHYVASMAYPAASAALIDAVCLEAGLTIDTSTLRREAGVQRERLDQLVAGNPEHAEMLAKLEMAYDEVHGGSSTVPDSSMPIPTVDELAAEVEQFLRDQQ